MKKGEVGEQTAEIWFRQHGWKMVRTQPPISILGMVTPAMVAVLKRFSPRLAAFGHMVIARIGKGGIADYTGYRFIDDDFRPYYVACEVKEAAGDTMPASRLDPDQRTFLASLPDGCAFVGILWGRGFGMHIFKERGSYKRDEAIKN